MPSVSSDEQSIMLFPNAINLSLIEDFNLYGFSIIPVILTLLAFMIL